MKVAICERSALFRESLARVVTSHGHQLVCAAGEPDRVAAEVERRGADVLLVDAGSARTEAVARVARQHTPGLQVLILATAEETESAHALLRAGLAAAVLDHGAALRTLERAVGGQVAAASPRRHTVTAVVRRHDEDLTAREVEVVEHLVAGRGTDAIAMRLAVSPSTVHSHVKNVLRKLGARNRVEAVAIYVADGRTHLPATG